MNVNVTLLLTTVPDAAAAQKLAADALAARLCACVTQLGPVQSSYHWQGQLETAQEIQLLFKTSAARALEHARAVPTGKPSLRHAGNPVMASCRVGRLWPVDHF
ncbi:periplasmic divalent cation tolerance protein [Burkholderia sp. OAS925]